MGGVSDLEAGQVRNVQLQGLVRVDDVSACPLAPRTKRSVSVKKCPRQVSEGRERTFPCVPSRRFRALACVGNECEEGGSARQHDAGIEGGRTRDQAKGGCGRN